MNEDKKGLLADLTTITVFTLLGSILTWCLVCAFIHWQTATEPEQIHCYDRVYGFVYGCEVREDGDIEIRINEDGNRVIVGLCEKDPRYK